MIFSGLGAPSFRTQFGPNVCFSIARPHHAVDASYSAVEGVRFGKNVRIAIADEASRDVGYEGGSHQNLETLDSRGTLNDART